jgi:hypothetical protein
MKDLKLRVERMLEGEKKRREVALKFVEELKEIILPVAETLWGQGTEEDKKQDTEYTAIWITKKKEDKRFSTNLYFRFRDWQGIDNAEEIGFYFKGEYDYGIKVWGEKLEDIKGKDFWYCIQLLIEWIPELCKLIDKKNESRDKLIGMLT